MAHSNHKFRSFIWLLRVKENLSYLFCININATTVNAIRLTFTLFHPAVKAFYSASFSSCEWFEPSFSCLTTKKLQPSFAATEGSSLICCLPMQLLYLALQHKSLLVSVPWIKWIQFVFINELWRTVLVCGKQHVSRSGLDMSWQLLKSQVQGVIVKMRCQPVNAVRNTRPQMEDQGKLGHFLTVEWVENGYCGYMADWSNLHQLLRQSISKIRGMHQRQHMVTHGRHLRSRRWRCCRFDCLHTTAQLMNSAA